MNQDELLIRRMIERWAVWRDAGDWERFATVWHPDGVMMATWFQGPFADFIRVTQEGWAKGVSILHFLGGSAIEVAGDRAIAQTKMTISQRGLVEGVPLFPSILPALTPWAEKFGVTLPAARNTR